MDIKELKAKAYDILAQIQYLQGQLNLVNQEINKISQQDLDVSEKENK